MSEKDGGRVLPGMSLRDWFAGQAVSAALHVAGTATYPDGEWGLISEKSSTAMAQNAYLIADAMMDERAK